MYTANHTFNPNLFSHEQSTSREENSAQGWLSVDPMTVKRPGLSPFNFVQNNPIMRMDPNGLIDYFYKGKRVGSDGNDEDKRNFSILKSDYKAHFKNTSENVELGVLSSAKPLPSKTMFAASIGNLRNTQEHGGNRESATISLRNGTNLPAQIGSEGTVEEGDRETRINAGVDLIIPEGVSIEDIEGISHSHLTGSVWIQGVEFQKQRGDEPTQADMDGPFKIGNMSIISGHAESTRVNGQLQLGLLYHFIFVGGVLVNQIPDAYAAELLRNMRF